jgi:ketosteroid isomerase-like protein
MRLILIPLACLALTACSPDPAKVEADIRKSVRAYVETTDVPASIAMLDEAGAVTSISGDGKIIRGRDAIREEANRNLAFLRQITIAVGSIEVTRVGATHALAIAPFSVSPAAVPQVTMAEGAATLLVIRRDSGWKVVHEHYSYSVLRRP